MAKKSSQPRKWSRILLTGSKILVAFILFLVMIPTMGAVWAKDSRKDPSYCANCHEDPYYTSWAATDHALAFKHGELSISCQTCHDRTLAESLDEMVSYAQDDYTFPLREHKYPQAECLKCHGSYEDIVPLTDPSTTELERNPHESHQGELECGICHNMHRDSVDACSECHAPIIEEAGWESFE